MKQLILLILSVAFLSACSSGRSNSTKMQRGGGTLPQEQEQLLTDQSTLGGCHYQPGGLEGIVYSNNDAQFFEEIYGLTTAKGDPDSSGENGIYLGDVSGQCGASTGVRFMGKVNVQGGFIKGQSNTGQIQSSAEFLLVIFDKFAAETRNEPEESKIPGIGFFADRASGYVQGDDVRVELTWDGGIIDLEGKIQGEDISGDIHYKNSKHFNGQAPAQGQIGKFVVPVCKLFVCQ